MSDVINAHDLGVAGGYIIEAAMQGDIDKLKADNAELRKYVTKLEAANLDVTARLTDYIGQYDPTDAFVAEVKAENAKLRKELEAEHALAETLGHFHEDAKADNAKLREQGARLFDKTLELGTENAKLRELCADMLSEDIDQHWPEFTRRAFELGVEVEHD